MKKVSAFQVFNSKKKSKDELISGRPPTGGEDKNPVPIRRAQSTHSVERGEKQKDSGSGGGSGSRGKRFLNALKSGNIRESIRLSAKKHRPSSLTSLDNGSPFPGFSQISLVGLKNSNEDKGKARKRILEPAAQTSTPLSRKSPQRVKKSKESKGTPQLPKKSTQVSSTILKLKSESPKLRARSESNANMPEESSVGKESTSEPSAGNTNMNSQDAFGSQLIRRSKRRNESESNDNDTNIDKKKRKTNQNSTKDDLTGLPLHQDMPYMYDSTVEAGRMFECMIHPVKPDRFFSDLWEKKPLLVKRHTPSYNKGWFSTAELDKILRQNNIQWGVNLDATSFINDKRETHNQSGRAYAPVVWDMYQSGCSLRLLNPQTYSRNVWKVLSVLQEFFGCCVGANIYLTPPGTQGFAPHYDDIEAFIIQLEGKKHWKLYSPRNDEEVLPRFSSGNFSQQEVGEPILDTVLEAGDLLYFPRGTIHQGNATDEHSLHITVSCYQMNSWGDLLQKLLPAAIQLAMEENVEFRTGLPRNYLNYMGIVHSEKNLPERKVFFDKVQSLMSTMMESLPLDSACDQMGKQLMHDSMPPVLVEGEKSCSVHGAGERWDRMHKRVMDVAELQPETAIKLIRRGCLRLLTEEDKVYVYYNVENARIYRSSGPHFMEITAEMAPAVEYLINAYPEYISIDSLPLENVADQLEITTLLYEKGLLITGEPLEPTYDEPGDETDDEL